MNSITFFSPANPDSPVSFAPHFSSHSGCPDLSRLLLLHRHTFVPVFSGNRLLESLPVAFAYSPRFFGMPKAELRVIGGSLKGKVVIIEANKDANDNKRRCLDKLMKDHIKPYLQRTYPELTESPPPKPPVPQS